MRDLFLTFFYSGYFPKAPGTAGTLAGALVGWLVLRYFPVSTLFLLTILVTIVAIRQIDIEEEKSGIHDASRIVIDEVAGIWIAFTLSSATWIQIALSILFFRFFDIFKPSLIGRIDREAKGGLGVMGDDLLAGVFAGICSAGVYDLLCRFGYL